MPPCLTGRQSATAKSCGRRLILDIRQQLTRLAGEVLAEPVDDLGADVRPRMVGHLRQGRAMDAGGFSHLGQSHDAPLLKGFVSDQLWQAESYHYECSINEVEYKRRLSLTDDDHRLLSTPTVALSRHEMTMNDEENAMQSYITTEQLASRIHYDVRTIRNRLKDSVLLEGVHYIRPFGGRKLLFVWEAIERDIGKVSATQAAMIPMANGGVAHG